MIEFSKYMVHTANLRTKKAVGGGTAWREGGTEFNAADPTPCYAYFGSLNWMLDQAKTDANTVESAPSRWIILLPATLINTLNVGDRVEDIVDENDVTIREHGTVSEVNTYRHRIYGAQCVIAFLAE